VYAVVSTTSSAAIADRPSLFPGLICLLSNSACKAMVRLANAGSLHRSSQCVLSFYCIVLLTTLFVSSCYWQPFPLDSPLTTPWSENITTFADALKASLPADYDPSPALPSVMRAVDRCWCDFTGSFFEPFNVSHWEYLSVLKVSQDLERKRKAVAPPETLSTDKQETSSAAYISRKDTQDSTISETLWNFLFFPFSLQTPNKVDSSSFSQDVLLPKVSNPDRAAPSGTGTSPPTATPGTSSSPTSNKLTLAREYDLQPYGLGLVVDLGW
jgi:hypothetical protein